MNHNEIEHLRIKAYYIFEFSHPCPKESNKIIKWERDRRIFIEQFIREENEKKKKNNFS